jgi:hypothetical protein|tara:strand:+ start:94 stop:354 length:261 start_codon:yes stop_codon:yes gene_type:complete
MDTTDIEKKSLEAHVELCAERYRMLELKIENVDTKMSNQATVIQEIHDLVHELAEKRNTQIINWGIGIIASLVGAVAWFATHYFKS